MVKANRRDQKIAELLDKSTKATIKDLERVMRLRLITLSNDDPLLDQKINELINDLLGSISDDMKYENFKFPSIECESVDCRKLRYVNTSDSCDEANYDRKVSSNYSLLWTVKVSRYLYFAYKHLDVVWYNYLKYLNDKVRTKKDE